VSLISELEEGDRIRVRDQSRARDLNGEVKEITDDMVAVEYITFDYAMGSTIQTPRVVEVPHGDVLKIFDDEDE
jgi:hypothetical protein